MVSQKERLQRLNEILTILKEKKGKAKFSEIFSQLVMKYGISQNTFWSYIEDLTIARKIDYPTVRRVPFGGPDDFTINLLES
jgi:hypothetical protein